MAAESPNEADGGRRNPYLNYNIMGYCLWGFQMLIGLFKKLNSVFGHIRDVESDIFYLYIEFGAWNLWLLLFTVIKLVVNG